MKKAPYCLQYGAFIDNTITSTMFIVFISNILESLFILHLGVDKNFLLRYHIYKGNI